MTRYEPHCDCLGGHVSMLPDPNGRWCRAEVKPITFNKRGSDWWGTSPFGIYVVGKVQCDDTEYWTFWEPDADSDDTDAATGQYPSERAALSAAQADFKARILSALVEPTMPDPTDPRAVADDPSGIVQQMPEVPQHGWLIHKVGRGWYRPNAQGYTSSVAEAGRYSHKDALSYSHPNGWDGPRDEITIKHEGEVVQQMPGGGADPFGPERIWLSPEGAFLPYQPTMHWEWQEYLRRDISRATEADLRSEVERLTKQLAQANAVGRAKGWEEAAAFLEGVKGVNHDGSEYDLSPSEFAAFARSGVRSCADAIAALSPETDGGQDAPADS
ncbi:hypothetical protein [Paracoccus yeei]|uniref:hypothetical protein n=1 Tax=Paracoccus yeei TaxID=147645 RepID=UPI003BF8C2DA